MNETELEFLARAGLRAGEWTAPTARPAPDPTSKQLLERVSQERDRMLSERGLAALTPVQQDDLALAAFRGSTKGDGTRKRRWPSLASATAGLAVGLFLGPFVADFIGVDIDVSPMQPWVKVEIRDNHLNITSLNSP